VNYPGPSITPNPFTTTTIHFQGTEPEELRIYDLNGHLIRYRNPKSATHTQYYGTAKGSTAEMWPLALLSSGLLWMSG